MSSDEQQRLERLEELAMFADRRHERAQAEVEELSRQVAALHVAVERLEKRLKDVERSERHGHESPLPEDEVPPHNAF